jgi:hypothetical protein
MEDVELVIKIPEKLYKHIMSMQLYITGRRNGKTSLAIIFAVIKNGIPLPKGHGRLIDADDIRVIELEDSVHIIRHEKGDEVDVYISAPTIIEADREVEEPEI